MANLLFFSFFLAEIFLIRNLNKPRISLKKNRINCIFAKKTTIMAKIITLGEIMLRLSPPNKLRLSQATSFDAYYGGGEANVAVSLGHLGHQAEFVSKLPDNELGQAVVNNLRQYGVQTQHIVRGKGRLGLYFLEEGNSVRPSKVFYDRENSAIALATEQDFDFDQIMQGADWFHWSGITPALSPNMAKITALACQAAKKHGLTVSVDLNFREKLWSKEQAQRVMIPLMQYVDVYVGNEFHAQSALGFTPSSGSVRMQKSDQEFKESLAELRQQFGFKVVVNALRNSFTSNKNGLKAFLLNSEGFFASKYYEIENIIGRVGGGDALTAGLIHGLLSYPNPQHALDFAIAASVLKLTIVGDVNLVSAQEVQQFLQTGGDANVKR